MGETGREAPIISLILFLIRIKFYKRRKKKKKKKEKENEFETMVYINSIRSLSTNKISVLFRLILYSFFIFAYN